jgi:riboflavin kinase
LIDLKIQHYLPTLLFLLSKGAKNNYVTITTITLGKQIRISQQTASKHLVELEKEGFIKRIINGRNISVKITTHGYLEIAKISKTIQACLKISPHIRLEGTLTSGMGEGAYYMSLKGYTKQFETKIGYTPFPGTLNVKLIKREFIESSKQFDALDNIKINGFSDKKRTFGWVKCFAAKLNKDIDCHLIRLERTHHDPSIIELVSKSNIRKVGRLKDNSKVTILVPLLSNTTSYK